jgi:predicted metalloprotease
MKRLLTRIALVGAVLGVLIGASSLVATAKAINPAQTSVTTVVNLEYWDLEAFWKPILNYYGRAYSRPYVNYYDYYSNGRLMDYNVPNCWTKTTTNQHGTEGFYCAGSNTIWIDYNQQVGNLAKYGDGAVGFWLAHEFGHAIQIMYGLSPRIVPNMELQADCFAGMYVRYGIGVSHRLVGDDYGEARYQISLLSWNDTSHGTPTQRLANFDWGYNQYAFGSCINGYN